MCRQPWGRTIQGQLQSSVANVIIIILGAYEILTAIETKTWLP
jgi:hypothetical protein